MQAEVVALLSSKGRFPTEQALVLAEAFDMAIEQKQFVTVPIIDARFAALGTRFAAVDARFVALEAKMDARFSAVDARFVASEARMDARFAVSEAKIDAKFERWAVRLIIAMILSQTALGPVGMSVFESAHRALSTLLH